MAKYLQGLTLSSIKTHFCRIADICFRLLYLPSDIYKKRNMKEDIHIDPKKEDERLMFYFAPPSRNLDVSKDSNSYRIIHCMLDKMMKGFDESPEQIGFIGGRDIIEYALVFLLDSYEKYVDSVLMSDLFPYTRHANFKRGYQNRSRRDLNAK